MQDLTVLVVDDDKEICDSIGIYLKNEGLNVLKAYDGLQALEMLSDNTVHLILLDIMMPRLDGIGAMVKIRQDRNIPIILISAKSEDTDKILGLNMGADDYITKPFNPLELIARVRSALRRYVTLGDMPKQENVLKTGGLVLNTVDKTLTVDGEYVKLTPIEFRILELLMENRFYIVGCAK